MNLKSSNADPEIRKSNIKQSMPQKKGVGGIGEAIRSAAPWPCARRERRAKRTSIVLYFLTLVPQVQYVTLVMDLGAPAMPPTRLVLARSHLSLAIFFFVEHHFWTSFSSSFLSHFGVTFEAPNRPKCPQATIQNRPSQNMCPIFGFGSFFVNFRPPSILESELLA